MIFKIMKSIDKSKFRKENSNVFSVLNKEFSWNINVSSQF